MSDIVIKMKDGTKKEFIDRGAPGGRYSNSLSFAGGFAIVTDPYGEKTAIPAQDISEIKHASQRRGF